MSAPQDFEALTPNLLARTIETVEGGGLIILLLRSLSSLTSLYTMVMVSSILFGPFASLVSHAYIHDPISINKLGQFWFNMLHLSFGAELNLTKLFVPAPTGCP